MPEDDYSDEVPIHHTRWFGSFIIRNGEIIENRLFPKDPEEIAKRRIEIKNGNILDEEKDLVDNKEELKVTSERLEGLGFEKTDLPKGTEVKPSEFSYDEGLLQKALQRVGEMELKRSVDIGHHLAKAVETTQDLNETINILLERLRDWYSIHFPELEENVETEKFVELIEENGSRDTILNKIDHDFQSVGGDISGEEERLYRRLAGIIRRKMEYREELWNYVNEKMKQNAPTVTELTGARLGAELIAKAGSLEKMAKMPSSTIQVLGAEKALFKHLNKGTKPPKHGLLLQHPDVHKADKELRGKIARAFANKIAIAARVDHFGEESKGEQLKKELDKRLKEIKSQH